MLGRSVACALILLGLTSPASAEQRSLRGLHLGMTQEEAIATLSHFRFFCEAAIQKAYHRHHGTLCRYKEYHFGISFWLRPDDGTVYRIEVEDRFPNGFDVKQVDRDLEERFGPPDESKRNALISGSYIRRWAPDLTVRLEDYEEDAIRLTLADPNVSEAVQKDWYTRF